LTLLGWHFVIFGFLLEMEELNFFSLVHIFFCSPSQW
jgi:hypothetical protein